MMVCMGRSGRVRAGLTALMVAAMATGCTAASGVGTSQESTTTSRPVASSTLPPVTSPTVPESKPTTTTTTTLPQVAPLPTVLDVTPVAPEDADVKANSMPEPPPGMERLSVAVTDGYGGFSIAYPRGWSQWLIGGDPDPVAAVAEGQDPAWGLMNRAIMTNANEVGDHLAIPRIHYADPSSPGLRVLTVTLTAEPDLVSEGLGNTLAASFEAVHGEVLSVNQYPLDGGAFVELTVRFDNQLTGWLEPVVEQHAFYFDDHHLNLWSVTCNLHESIAEESAELCTNIGRNFIVWGPAA